MKQAVSMLLRNMILMFVSVPFLFISCESNKTCDFTLKISTTNESERIIDQDGLYQLTRSIDTTTSIYSYPAENIKDEKKYEVDSTDLPDPIKEEYDYVEIDKMENNYITLVNYSYYVINDYRLYYKWKAKFNIIKGSIETYNEGGTIEILEDSLSIASIKEVSALAFQILIYDMFRSIKGDFSELEFEPGVSFLSKNSFATKGQFTSIEGCFEKIESEDGDKLVEQNIRELTKKSKYIKYDPETKTITLDNTLSGN